MIPKECKRLAEVDFPIAVVSKHSAREKSIRHGHPSTLHLWWARRPLASCRAMLLGLLLPDPCDPHCPVEFKARARKALLAAPGWDTERNKQQVKTDEGLRKALLRFIGDVADWDVANHPGWISASRALVQAAHPKDPPLVVDPFAGGGSIPLEALRLGCEAFASDLNPVACMILKVMLEDIPHHGPKLADELRRVGGEIKKQAEKELAEFYPKDPDGATPIAYLWARTVKCESPHCGAEIPLVRSFWLCKKTNRRRALRCKSVHPKGKTPYVEVEIFVPKTEKDVHGGTVTNARATCLCCDTVLPADRVRAQLSEQQGGADVVSNGRGHRIGGARMLAVVTLRNMEPGRHYRLPSDKDYESVCAARRRFGDKRGMWGSKHLLNAPINPIRPSPNARGFSAVTRYGINTFAQLFTARQILAMSSLSALIAHQPSGTVAHLLAFALSKLADLSNSLCRWEPMAECPRQLFTRHAAAIAWDFAEGIPISTASGSYQVCVENVTTGLGSLRALDKCGTVNLADASSTGLPSESSSLWFTDPPYYDAIPYADLSDFFFAWLKQCLPDISFMRDPFDLQNPLTPKTQECVWNQAYLWQDRPKDGHFFEVTIGKCFVEARRLLSPDGIGGVVFAHSTTEGWEALLGGLVRAKWTITGSWPIATEMSSRMRARETAALATSVHLICRPRPDDAPVGDWGDVLRELPKRVGDWMERLQNEGVRGADLVFACIGPALEIFSRYRKVETADGKELKLDDYLSKVWEVVGRSALEQVLGTAEARARNGAAGALEEDSRLTALFLWTIQSTNAGTAAEGDAEDTDNNEGGDEDEEDSTPKGKTKGFSLVFDVVRRFAQPLGIDLPKWEGRILETKKGVVRLLAISERAKQLFGDDGADAVADLLERDPSKNLQQMLFPELEEERVPKIRGRRGRVATDGRDLEMKTEHAATTLDRVHAAMLLQAGGQTNGLRALIKAEQERGPDFLRLANALSALYPSGSEEKRLLDAMLLAVPR